jgi:hypothetical protein
MADCEASMTQPEREIEHPRALINLDWKPELGGVCGMERVARKIGLHDECVDPLIENREEAMQTFYAILEMGKSLYADTEADSNAQPGHRRVYRVVPLRES